MTPKIRGGIVEISVSKPSKTIKERLKKFQEDLQKRKKL